MTKTNLASSYDPATKRAAALAAGYVLVPVPLRLRLREAANAQRVSREVRRGR